MSHLPQPNPDDLIICRCENVSLAEIKRAIHQGGARTVNQVKKLTRAGMGLCQGRTCAGVVALILSLEAQAPLGAEAFTARAPVRSLKIEDLAAAADQFEEPIGPVRVIAFRGAAEDEAEDQTASKGVD